MAGRSISLLALLTLLCLVAVACSPQRSRGGGGGGGDDSTPCDNYCVQQAECSNVSVTSCQEAYDNSAGQTEAVQSACQEALDVLLEGGCGDDDDSAN